MPAIIVEISESLEAAAGEFARASGVTVEQLVASARDEKVSAVGGREWLAAWAARGDRTRVEAALSKVPDTAPEERDRPLDG
jgi:hypothetical protein